MQVHSITPGSRPDSAYIHLESGGRWEVRGSVRETGLRVSEKLTELFVYWAMMRQQKLELAKLRKHVVDICMKDIDDAMNKALTDRVEPVVSKFLADLAAEDLAEAETDERKAKPVKGKAADQKQLSGAM